MKPLMRRLSGFPPFEELEEPSESLLNVDDETMVLIAYLHEAAVEIPNLYNVSVI